MKFGTVCVTGANGFIGSALCRQLSTLGYAVRAVDQVDDPVRITSIPNLEYRKADMRDPDQAEWALDGTDSCIALAARSAGVGYFSTHSAEMLKDNCVISANTTHAAAKLRMRRYVYISSSCVYDETSLHAAREGDLLGSALPPNGYPFSKLVGEQFCRAYWDQYGLEHVIIRPFNVYGPGEKVGAAPGDGHVIPDLTHKIINGDYPLELFGDGSQTRCFTFVDDVTTGIVLALESRAAKNEDFNLGWPKEISILQLAQMLWTLCERLEPMKTTPRSRFSCDIQRRAVDISKANKLLGWRPRVELESGLKRYIEWYREQAGLVTERVACF